MLHVTGQSVIPLPEPTVPRVIKLLGGRFRYGPLDYRMRWGQLVLKGWRLACELALFEDGYSLHLGLGGQAYIRLPFLNRWAYDPHEIMEAWGFSTSDGCVHLHWGRHTKIIELPWARWRHVAAEVLNEEGVWVPYVGSWEHDKPPDGRHTEQYPYYYLTDNGERQEVVATVHAQRWRWRLKWLPLVRRTRISMDVEFSNEVGERVGSWKGGTVGCGYDLRPGESLRRCLKRMQRERRFD